jgi:hypothetical protein
MSPQEIIESLQQGCQANLNTRRREGSMILLGDQGQVIMTGDLHDHERNYEKLLRLADLENEPETYLIIHELIHRGHAATPNHCHSYQMVARAAALKAKFPDQVHYLMGNHEMAQASRTEVLKNGQPMVQALLDGAKETFGADADKVIEALDEFILSLPIAVRTKNRVWLSHSLPSPVHTKTFDHAIFEEPITHEMISSDLSLRALLWDRRQSDASLAELSRHWAVDHFIVGHQAQETGYFRPLEQMMILASDHNHGHYLLFDLGEDYSSDALFGLVKPLARIA